MKFIKLTKNIILFCLILFSSCTNDSIDNNSRDNSNGTNSSDIPSPKKIKKIIFPEDQPHADDLAKQRLNVAEFDDEGKIIKLNIYETDVYFYYNEDGKPVTINYGTKTASLKWENNKVIGNFPEIMNSVYYLNEREQIVHATFNYLDESYSAFRFTYPTKDSLNYTWVDNNLTEIEYHTFVEDNYYDRLIKYYHYTDFNNILTVNDDKYSPNNLIAIMFLERLLCQSCFYDFKIPLIPSKKLCYSNGIYYFNDGGGLSFDYVFDKNNYPIKLIRSQFEEDPIEWHYIYE